MISVRRLQEDDHALLALVAANEEDFDVAGRSQSRPLYEIGVREAHRRHGVGRALMGRSTARVDFPSRKPPT